MSLELIAPRPLTPAHHLDEFSCGEPVLDDWLKRRTIAKQTGGASRTFVAADRSGRVYGYCAMAAGAISQKMATVDVRALLVHAFHERAKSFYEHYRFEVSPADPMPSILRLSSAKA